MILYIYLIHIAKDDNSNVSSFSIAVLIKLDILLSLENCIRSVYYNAYPLTLYFQMQFIKVEWTINTKTAIKCSLRKEILSARRRRDLKAKKRKYYDEPEQKSQTVIKRYENEKESIKQYKKEKYAENRISNITYQKVRYQEVQLAYKKCRYQENPESKIKHQ